MKLIEHYIGGKNYSGNSKRKSKVFDPATGEQSAEVKLATKEDVNKAVENAKNSFENYYLWILITTNALLVSALSNYWLFKTRDTHSYYEVIGVTGGILKIFQVINHYSGTLILKYIQKLQKFQVLEKEKFQEMFLNKILEKTI